MFGSLFIMDFFTGTHSLPSSTTENVGQVLKLEKLIREMAKLTTATKESWECLIPTSFTSLCSEGILTILRYVKCNK